MRSHTDLAGQEGDDGGIQMAPRQLAASPALTPACKYEEIMTTLPDQPVPPAAESEEEKMEDALDEALKESFPASDPVAIAIEHPDKPVQVRQ